MLPQLFIKNGTPKEVIRQLELDFLAGEPTIIYPDGKTEPVTASNTNGVITDGVSVAGGGVIRNLDEEVLRAIIECGNGDNGRRVLKERIAVLSPEERRLREVRLALYAGFTLRRDGTLDYGVSKACSWFGSNKDGDNASKDGESGSKDEENAGGKWYKRFIG